MIIFQKRLAKYKSYNSEKNAFNELNYSVFKVNLSRTQLKKLCEYILNLMQTLMIICMKSTLGHCKGDRIISRF